MADQLHIHSDKYYRKPLYDPRCGLCKINRERHMKKNKKTGGDTNENN